MNAITTQLDKARKFLVDSYPNGYTADRIKDQLNLTISVSTLAPKLRMYSRKGWLRREYFVGGNNRKQVLFSCGWEYYQQSKDQAEVDRHAANIDRMCDEARDAGVFK